MANLVDLNDMPWLTQGANPVGSLVAGAQIGSQIAARRQEGQRINLVERQLAQQAAMNEVERVTMMQQQRINSVKLQEVMEMRQLEADTKEKQMNLLNAYRERMSAQDPEGAQLAVLDFASSTPFASKLPIVKTLLDDSRNGLQAKMELAKLKGTDTADMKNSEKLTQLKQAVIDANASGDPDAIARAQMELDSFVEVSTPSSETIYDPATGNPIIERGKKIGNPGGLTQANLTRAQSSLKEAEDLIDSANRLLPLIDNETVGIQSFVGSWVNDRILAQRFPNLASSKRANAQVVAAEYRARMIKKHRSDSNISEGERKSILMAFPNIDSPIDSPARAKQSIIESRQLAATDAIIVANKLNQPIPVSAAMVLDATELERLVKSGAITPDLALKVYDARQR